MFRNHREVVLALTRVQELRGLQFFPSPSFPVSRQLLAIGRDVLLQTGVSALTPKGLRVVWESGRRLSWQEEVSFARCSRSESLSLSGCFVCTGYVQNPSATLNCRYPHHVGLISSVSEAIRSILSSYRLLITVVLNYTCT